MKNTRKFEKITRLFKNLALISLLSLVTISTTGASSLPDITRVASRNMGAVVALSVDGNSSTMCSGFVVSHDGYIYTNHHCIDHAKTVNVKFKNGKVYPAKVIGSDKATDVALLKISAKKLQRVQLGRSNRLRSGAWVVAIGMPFGFEHSVTVGVISSPYRVIEDEPISFIQSDVAINPGNSGGPLFDERGRVIGITSQIFSPVNVRAYIGITFSIPIDAVNDMVRKIKIAAKYLPPVPDDFSTHRTGGLPPV